MQRLSAHGVIVTQAGSPLFARQAFWSVAGTVSATPNPLSPGEGLNVTPYHAYVPSFGDWGFVLAGLHPPPASPSALPDGLRFYAHETWPALRTFPRDMSRVEAEVNSVLTHALVGYYEDGWAEWFGR